MMKMLELIVSFAVMPKYISGEFATGKYWDDVWKLDFLKQHLPWKSHLAGVNAKYKVSEHEWENKY